MDIREKIKNIINKHHETGLDKEQSIYIALFEWLNKDYYDIFGVKLFITGAQLNREKAINECIKIFKKNGLTVHVIDYEKPKISNKSEFFSYINSIKQPLEEK